MADYRERILAFLEKTGAENIAVRNGAKHPRIVFEWHGKKMTYIIAGTSGDTLRGHKEAITDLRHMMGIVPPVKRIGKRRARKSVRKDSLHTECPTISALPDWRQEMLATLSPEQLRAQLDLAWLRLWRDCMARVGGESLLAERTAA